MVLIEKIKNIITLNIKNGTFPGAVVAVELNGKIVCRVTAGFREPKSPGGEMTPDALFDLASLTKPLATALLTLIVFESEKEPVSAKISHFFPDLPEESRDITVFQLLTHSSGLPPVPDIYLSFPDPAKIDRKAAEKILLNRVPVKKPGTEIIYSCTGYLFTGLILEKITGMSPGPLFKKLIADRLGLKDLFFNPEKKYLSRIAPTEYCPWRKCKIGRAHV